jgi:hypothetical protein
MAATAPDVRVLAARLVAEIRTAGFEIVAQDDRVQVFGADAFPTALADRLIAQKAAVLALLATADGWYACSRHATDYRPWCGGCGPAFADDGMPTAIASPEHLARIAARLQATRS